MAEDVKTIIRHYQKAISEPDDYVMYWIDPSNPYKWWCVLHGMMGQDDVLNGGQYLVEVTAPTEFPHKPPVFLLHTPNGVYGTDKPICISIGHYHSGSYPAAIGMRGFITEIANGMICQKDLGGGINVLSFNAAKIRDYAVRSVNYNHTHYPVQTQSVLEAYADYKTKWTRPIPVPAAAAKPAGLSSMFKRKAPAKVDSKDSVASP